MTDKQIIIDGVNVAGCVRLQDDEISCDLGGECKGWENCYYKQLKAKEQECNKLYIQLKADEEYHKEEENTLRKIIKNKEERNIKLYKENNKLEQTLIEIKEIAEKAGNTQYLTFPDFDLKQNAKMLMGQFNGYLQQILQKISECEVENEI